MGENFDSFDICIVIRQISPIQFYIIILAIYWYVSLHNLGVIHEWNHVIVEVL